MTGNEERRHEGVESQLVVFHVGSEEYGIPISYVREIINQTRVVRLPKMPSFIIGVINLRGRVIPVIDLADKFALPLDGSEQTSKKILIVEMDNTMVGYLVSAVSEVLTVSRESLEKPSYALANLESNLVEYICSFDKRLFPVLDVLQMFSGDETGELADVMEQAN